MNKNTTNVHLTKDIKIRFLEFFKPKGKDHCWEWKGKINKEKNPIFYMLNREVDARKIAWVLDHYIKLTPIHKVERSCPSKLCVNPDHLYRTQEVRSGNQGEITIFPPPEDDNDKSENGYGTWVNNAKSTNTKSTNIEPIDAKSIDADCEISNNQLVSKNLALAEIRLLTESIKEVFGLVNSYSIAAEETSELSQKIANGTLLILQKLKQQDELSKSQQEVATAQQKVTAEQQEKNDLDKQQHHKELKEFGNDIKNELKQLHETINRNHLEHTRELQLLKDEILIKDQGYKETILAYQTEKKSLFNGLVSIFVKECNVNNNISEEGTTIIQSIYQYALLKVKDPQDAINLFTTWTTRYNQEMIDRKIKERSPEDFLKETLINYI